MLDPEATFTINSNGDTVDVNPGNGICADAAGDCTLRAAIQEANATSGADVINFTLTTPATIQLNSALNPAELVISETVTINGPGARLLTVQGNANTALGVFNITSAVTTAANINGLTIADSGARGINNDGKLNLSDAVVRGNTFGIYNTAEINITRTLVNNNSSGGIYLTAPSVANISNTTITDNTSNNGGGIHSKSANVTLNNVTISHNSVTGSGANGNGGGFYYDNTTALGPKIRNTIIAQNTATTAGPDIFSVSSGPPNNAKFESKGNNLIGRSAADIGFVHNTNNDKVGTIAAPVDPLLGPLQNNGGILDTRALLDTSPARDAGNNCVTASTCGTNNPTANLTTDQRGTNFPRLYDSTVDMGAFESFYPVATIATFAPANRGTSTAAFELTIDGTNFVANSQVRWNGANRTTTFVSNTQIKAQIPATDLTAAGDFPVTVANPTPGGGPSAASNYTVVNCAFAIDPTSQLFTAAGGTGNVTVTAPSGCQWTATSNSPFITISSGTPGNGSGTLNFTVQANTGLERSGTITIAGQTFTVTQANGCTYSLNPTSATHPSSTGSYSFALTTSNSNCTWTATDDASWITVTNASGANSATINYSVTVNTGTARSGTITVTGALPAQTQTFSVNQDNGCTYALNPTSANFAAAGASGNFAVTTETGCQWSAASNAAWITVDSGTPGNGNGTVNFTVAANTGPARSGKITVNGQDFNITQDSGCSFSLSANSINSPLGGGNGSVNVTTAAGCEWTAVSNDPWITITSGTPGSGNGTVNFTVAANSGLARTGTMTIAGQTFTVNQANGCTYSLNPTSQNFTSAGGTNGAFAVQTSNPNCTWTASETAAWIDITGGSSGTGNGNVAFSVIANAGIARSDTITVSGAVSGQNQTFTVNQASGCTYSLNPTSANHPAAAGSYSVALTTSDPTCAWTATDDASWITITNPAGSNSATINYTLEANTGLARTGKITVNGQELNITQANGCTFTLNPTSANFPAAGGANSTFTVTAGNQACTWTAVDDQSWITVNSGTGTGNGAVNFSVDSNNGAERTGKIIINGQTEFNITQANGCTYSINPVILNASVAGGNSTFNINPSNSNCAWTAAVEPAAASWLSITNGSSGTGAGTISFTVAPNNGMARSGKIIAGGQEFTVNQANGCVYTLNPTNQNYPNTGATGATFAITASNQNCTWTATRNDNWLTITAGAAGTGNGTVTFDVAANTGVARTGTITVAGAVSGQNQTFTANQAIGCAYNLSANNTNIAAAGGTGNFNVTTASGCGWTAVSNAPWITINSGTPGSGNGTLNFTVAANAGIARSGTITVTGATAGQTYTFTVNQANGCTYNLTPAAANASAAGGNGSFDVATSDPACTWTATVTPANAAWVSISSGTSGTGAGTVNFNVGANNGLARAGTIAVNGAVAGQTATFTINQANGCTYSLNPTSASHPATAGSYSFALTTSNPNCTWTVTDDAAWINIANPTSGSNSATINYSLIANAGIARTGTITVTGAVPTQTQTFTVNQASGCTYSLNPTSANHPAAAGSYSVALTTSDPTCAWTATDDASWITVTNPAGSNSATINYTLEANTGLARTGKITVNGQELNITQANGCVYTLTPASRNFPVAGGTDNFALTTSNQNCTWTASRNGTWITLTSPTTGNGNSTITFDVASNNGLARSGGITITGAIPAQTVTGAVNQANGCVYTVNPTNQSYPNGATSNSSFAVTTSNQNCTWTATSADNWVTVSNGTNRTGDGSVTFSILANVGPARSTTITVAGAIAGQEKTFTVNQASGCTYTLNPVSTSFDPSGGSGSFSITTNTQTCSWTVSTPQNWISIIGQNSGTGNGTVSYNVQMNISPQRLGEIQVKEGTVTRATFGITQTDGCSYSLSLNSTNVAAAGANNLTFNVNAGGGCQWTAVSNAPWITINSGTPGNGGGTVNYSVGANTGVLRSGTITVTGNINGQPTIIRTFTVNQDNGCTIFLNPVSTNHPAGGTATASFAVMTSASGCTWTAAVAAANSSWVTITGTTGSPGNGTVNYTVAANTGPQRTGRIIITGQTGTVDFEITQADGCTYALSPTSLNISQGGGMRSFNVVTGAGCTWTTVINAPSWISISSGANGTGNGTVNLTIAANSGAERSGTVTVNGASGQSVNFTVNQISLIVTNKNDSGSGSLRQAVTNANNTPGDDIITFQAGVVGTIPLTTGEIQIINNGSLEIRGPGADFIEVSGSGNSRIFYIDNANVTISGMSLTGGNGVGLNSTSSNKYGGAIYVYVGSLTLDSVNVSLNTITVPVSQGNSGIGGGIYYFGGENHQIRNSTISANSCTFGAGYYNQNGSMTIYNSTITLNVAAEEGGGIYSVGDTMIRSTTIYNNRANATGHKGGGIMNEGGNLNFGNSIISGNTGPEITFSNGNFISVGNNLVGDMPGDANDTKSFVIYHPTDLKDIPPMLSVLSFYGGDVPTVGPLPGSPVINAGNNDLSVSMTDQRGSTRIVGDNIDIGAFEYNITVTPTAPNLPAATVGVQYYSEHRGIRVNGNNPGEPFEYFVVDGFLPDGLHLTQDGGLLTGNPTAAAGGLYQFTIKAVGTDGMAGMNKYNLLVNCAYTVNPLTQQIVSAGGTGQVNITAAPGCSWTVANSNQWITPNPASGTGNGTVNLTVPANTGPARSGQLTIAGKQVTVNQDNGCTFNLNPAAANNVPQNGASGSFSITTVGGCGWTASSNVPWITVDGNSVSGTGSGTVNYTIAANAGQSRSGKIIVTRPNGTPAEFNITQLSGCSYALSAPSENFPIAGGTGTFNITTAEGCAWTAAVNPPTATWVEITAGASGSGPGAIQFTVAANTGTIRSATIIAGGQTFTINQAGLSRTAFDFDGDGKADPTVYRPTDGAWYLLRSTAGFTGTQFGIAADKIAPADFDGDGKTDIAVFRDGAWYLLRSQLGFTSVQFGAAGDNPVPADYDGDGKADIGVFRPSSGSWFRLNSSNGDFVGTQFGASGDIAAPADFDGDGKADLNLYRRSDGGWYRLNSTNGQFFATQFGIAEDFPAPADFDGDRKADICVFRPSNGGWYRLNSTNGQFVATQFGAAGDRPVVTDFDGDGKADISVFRASTGNWFRLNSTDGQFVAIQFGAAGDKPVPAFYLP